MDIWVFCGYVDGWMELESQESAEEQWLVAEQFGNMPSYARSRAFPYALQHCLFTYVVFDARARVQLHEMSWHELYRFMIR